MKKINILVMICMMFIITTNGQDQHPVSYTAFVELIGSSNSVKGLLYQVEDSAIVLFTGTNHELVSEPDLNPHFKTIPASQINLIKLRPRGNVKRTAKKGAIYGGLAGMAIGGLEAAAYASDPWAEVEVGELLLAGAISGAMTGAIYGAIAGSFKTKTPINGSQHRFNYRINFLRSHAYRISDLAPADLP